MKVSTLRAAPFSLAWGSSVYAKLTAYNAYGESTVSEAGNNAVIITYADAPVELAEKVSERTATSITFTWQEGEKNGGSPVTDYRVSIFDSDADEFVILASGVVNTEFTATGLTAGLTYRFRVEAQNGFGYSSHSEEVTILCATRPEKPMNVLTTVVSDYVILNWIAPFYNGKQITSYKVMIRTSDLVFTEEKSICDGSSFAVIQNTQCIVQLSDLQVDPFNLMLGNSIQAQVSASNDYGTSEISEIGNGGVMVLVPDAPVQLTNDVSITNDNKIRITWSDGASNGGENVVDYRVWFDQSTQSYAILASGRLEKSYTTATTLVSG